MPQAKSGFAKVGKAKIYYETAGAGAPFLMIHAGVADSRQWRNEFTHFSRSHQVIRYDMRGYGKSVPVEGQYSHLSDLDSLLEALEGHEPLIVMGCSLGGGLALDFALTHPARVKALILVDAGPNWLRLDIPKPPEIAEADEALEAGNPELAAELEARVWFDGEGRSPEQVNREMRKLFIEMDRIALNHEAKNPGERLPNTDAQGAELLSSLNIPALLVVGDHDIAYVLAAADYMMENLRGARKAVIENAAHLPNMDQPGEFQRIVEQFLESLPA